MRVRLSANPVLIKELRGRMRGPRAYLFLTATLALLGGVSYGLYRLAVMTQNTYGGVPQGAAIGRGVFTGLVFVALMVICAATPFLTAGAISGEHERKTVDLLLATPLSPSSLLWGKLVAALSYVALVLLAALPLASLSFVFGGVSTEDMARAFLLLLGFAVTYAVIGLFFSALFRRTGPALVASYLTLALFALGTIFVYLVTGIARNQLPPNWLLIPNPLAAMTSLLSAGDGPLELDGFLEVMGGAEVRIPAVAGLAGGSVAARAVPLWQPTVGLYAWLTAILYLASTQLVRPVRRLRFSARTWTMMALLLAAPFLAVPAVYGRFRPSRLAAWARWLCSSPHNLVAGGSFSEPVEQAWQVRAGPGSQVEQIEADGRPALRLARAAGAPAEVTLTQVVSRTVAADGWLQVRAVLRIVSQDATACDRQGGARPLTLKLAYDDGDRRPHEWLQAFNICEPRAYPIQVPAGEWYTYESPNLLYREEVEVFDSWSSARVMPYVPPPPPRFIHSITIVAAGSSYEVEVAEVELISREGRPLAWGGGALGPLTPAPVPLMAVPLRVPPEPAAPPAAGLPAHLVDRGARVADWHEVGSELEDLFLQLTEAEVA